MAKKIIFSALTFAGAFVVGILIFFPISQVASKYIKGFVDKESIDLRYDVLNIGFFGAQVTNLKTGDLTVNKIIIKYNPIGALFKRFSFEAESPLFIAGGKMAGDTITADIKGSVAGLAKLGNFDGSGSLDIKGKYNINSREGSVEVSSGAVSLAHPLMNVEADELKAKAGIKGNIITIDNVAAKGKTALDGKGTVVLNTKKIEFSTLDIQGKAGMMGMNMDFKIQGPASSPRFVTQ